MKTQIYKVAMAAVFTLFLGFAAQFSIAFAQNVQPIYSFPPGGEYPDAGLTLGSDGNFYGTTSQGGSNGNGTVFQVTTNDVLTTLYSFSAMIYDNSNGQYTNSDGANPPATLTPGPDGNFYGATIKGGSGGVGTLFEITTNGMFKTLHSFAATTYNSKLGYTNSDGAQPYGGLTPGPAGNFYGTTANGGSRSDGTVFQMMPNGVVTTLYSFTGANDGAIPYAGLTQGPEGNFYGTTEFGGSNGSGTVFEVTTNGALTPLRSFAATIYNSTLGYTNSEGADPRASLTLGSDGNFYGTTYGGGSGGEGTVFEVTTNGVLTTLYSFADGYNEVNPNALALGPDGNFYGTTQNGGNSGNGSVFQVTTNGVLTTLYSFTSGNDGGQPEAALALEPDGHFYGTTYGGGSGDIGTVFEVTTNGVLTTLVNFQPEPNGADANALTRGPAGNFYGTTEQGGPNGNGTIFEVTTDGVLTTLYSFSATTYIPGSGFTNSDGANPYGALTPGPDGSFYGTTSGGGTNGSGTIFEVTANGALMTLYSFTGGNDGGSPYAGLTPRPDGNFYGTTPDGGSSGDGTVFEVTTNGVLTTLAGFTNIIGLPYSGLTLGPDGNFYGTTSSGSTGEGTVFKVTTNGVLTALTNIASPWAGNPNSNLSFGLTLGPNGNFYGTTFYGGSDGWGTVFQVTTTGVLTTLYSFTGGNDGGDPVSLTLGPDGNLYGITAGEVNNITGTIFQITTNGTLTTLCTFDSPDAPLTLGPDGNFYGTTMFGNSEIYRLNISPPNIASEPVSVALPIGDTAHFQVSAGGALPFSYQWFFNTNTFLSNATSANLAIGPAITSNDGYYQVIVTNFFGSVTSSVASLTVVVEPNPWGISNNPSSGSTTLSLASYPGSTNYLYATTNLLLPLSQWQLVATNIAASDGLFQFIDPDTKGVPAKFYRLAGTPLNLLADSGFETQSGWTLFSGAQYSQNYAHSGSWSMLDAASSGVPGCYQQVPASPGMEFEMTGYGFTPTPLTGSTAYGILQITYFDSAGDNLGTVETSPGNALASQEINGNTLSGVWTFLDTGVATAPPNTAYLQAFTLYVGFSGSDEGVYFDDLSLVQLQ